MNVKRLLPLLLIASMVVLILILNVQPVSEPFPVESKADFDRYLQWLSIDKKVPQYTIAFVRVAHRTIPENGVWCVILTPPVQVLGINANIMNIDHFILVNNQTSWYIQYVPYENEAGWLSNGCLSWK